jgi:RNA polymerase sigma factor (sigma-70 family)
MTPGDPATPIELLRRAQAKDEAALAQLFIVVKGSVRRRVQQILGRDNPHVDDIAWDAMTRGAGVLAQCRATTDQQVFGWFRAIARNAALQELRRAAEPAAASPGADPSPGSPRYVLPRHLRSEMRTVLRIVLETLKPSSARILDLRAVEKLPWAEVGAALGITPNAAKMRYRRAVFGMRAKIVKLIIERAAGRGEDLRALEHYLARWAAAKLPDG